MGKRSADMGKRCRRALVALAIGWHAFAITPVSAQALRAIPTSEFARLVDTLSEAGGYFDTDNLISNEASYLHVLPALDRRGATGGAYIGVGPDQNFSYIARTRPLLAFLMDVRRDNLLQHLLFKALFDAATTRADYLALWLGRPAPPAANRWADRTVQALVAYFDTTPATSASRDAALEEVQRRVQSYGVRLTPADLATIARFHDTFIQAGLSLKFTTTGRAPRWYYPTLRDLLLQTDRGGTPASYLASEADFQYVKELQRRNRVIPVVGDLAGSHAMRAIGHVMNAHQAKLNALYVSNAEDYVLRDGGFRAYVANVTSLPRTPQSVIIRSWFGGPESHPHAVPGYFSVQLLQSVDVFARVAILDAMWSYRTLVNTPHIAPE